MAGTKKKKKNVRKKITYHVAPSRPVEEESIWVHFKGDKGGYAVGILNTQVKEPIRKDTVLPTTSVLLQRPAESHSLNDMNSISN